MKQCAEMGLILRNKPSQGKSLNEKTFVANRVPLTFSYTS